MTVTLGLVFLIVAIVLFGIAAFPVSSRFNLVAAGLFFYAAKDLVG